LLTLNVPLQVGKCTPGGTCTPGWEPLYYSMLGLTRCSCLEQSNSYLAAHSNKSDDGQMMQRSDHFD